MSNKYAGIGQLGLSPQAEAILRQDRAYQQQAIAGMGTPLGGIRQIQGIQGWQNPYGGTTQTIVNTHDPEVYGGHTSFRYDHQTQEWILWDLRTGQETRLAEKFVVDMYLGNGPDPAPPKQSHDDTQFEKYLKAKEEIIKEQEALEREEGA